MKRTILLALGGLFALVFAQSSFGGGDATIFGDDFETGSLSLWTAAAGNPLEVTNYTGAVPELGLYGAFANNRADRMHHNVIADNGGQEISGASAVTAWIYDSVDTRAYIQVLGYTGTGMANGGTTVDGTLAQVLAIGKYDFSGHNNTKYQARVMYGALNGWFNLDAPGAPSRSPGWHKFTIERAADNTTVYFLIDGVLAGTATGTTEQSWDTITVGVGGSAAPAQTIYDGISVDMIPEPSPFVLTLLGLGILACWGRLRK